MKKDKNNVKLSKHGNSKYISIPSFYIRFLEEQGKAIDSFDIKINQDNSITCIPIFK